MTDYSVPTPCTGVCTLDPKDKVCIGCFRSDQEIAKWRVSNNEERHVILSNVARRRAERL